MSDWSKLPTPDKRGEYATEADAALARAAQLRQVAIVNAGSDPFAEDEAPAPPSPSGDR